MSEEVQKTGSPAAEDRELQEAILAHKRKNALIAYLAVLFAVAFLLVAVSMIVENQRLQGTTSTMSGKIADLQDEYDQLHKKSKAQDSQIEVLQGNLKTAEITIDEQTASMAEMSEELESLRTENETLSAAAEELTAANEELTGQLKELQEENKTLSERADDTDEIYELLFRAQAADEAGRYSELAQILAQIEPKKDLLCPSALELYESLVID